MATLNNRPITKLLRLQKRVEKCKQDWELAKADYYTFRKEFDADLVALDATMIEAKIAPASAVDARPGTLGVPNSAGAKTKEGGGPSESAEAGF